MKPFNYAGDGGSDGIGDGGGGCLEQKPGAIGDGGSAGLTRRPVFRDSGTRV